MVTLLQVYKLKLLNELAKKSSMLVAFIIGKSGKPTHVYVDPCTTPSSCILHKGKNSTISVSFIPNGVVTKVTTVVHGIIGGIPIPFPMEGTDGCVKSGLTCPLKGGVEVKYFKSLPVKTLYPSVSTSFVAYVSACLKDCLFVSANFQGCLVA